ncbi:hypothetical protein ACFYWY_30045 [Streptomyces sp. NPDC002870]
MDRGGSARSGGARCVSSGRAPECRCAAGFPQE